MIFKSDIASGDIYKNLLQSARKNPLNHQKHEWVDIIKKNLTNTRPKLWGKMMWMISELAYHYYL